MKPRETPFSPARAPADRDGNVIDRSGPERMSVTRNGVIELQQWIENPVHAEYYHAHSYPDYTVITGGQQWQCEPIGYETTSRRRPDTISSDRILQ
jgi:hypothetical protein